MKLIIIITFIYFARTKQYHSIGSKSLISSPISLNKRLKFNLGLGIDKVDSSIEAQLNRLKFGYEYSFKEKNIQQNTLMTRLIKKKVLQSESTTLRVACNEFRPKGCEPLLVQTSSDEFKKSALIPLPCVVEGICPFLKFQCPRGHEWKAVPGSPVCIYCPICNNSNKIIAKKRKVTDKYLLNQKLKQAVTSYVASNQGQLIDIESTNFESYKSSVLIECKEGHRWTPTISNLIFLKTWCFQCNKSHKKLSHIELENTATYFGGRFLGSEFSDNKTLYFWECSKGHSFQKPVNFIRRRKGTKRKCSWCPTCTKNGVRFEWNPLVQELS